MHKPLLDLCVVLIVVQVAVLLVHAISDNELVVLEEIVTGREPTVHHALGQVIDTVLQSIVLHAEVIVVIADFHETLLDLYVVLIVVQVAVFLVHAIFNNELVILEEIVTGGEQTVHHARRQVIGAVLQGIIIHAEVIVIIADFHKACGVSRIVLVEVQFIIFFDNSVIKEEFTIRTKAIVSRDNCFPIGKS